MSTIELSSQRFLASRLSCTIAGRTSKSNTPETASVCSTGRSGSEHNDAIDDTHLRVPSIRATVGHNDPTNTSPIPGAPGVGSFLSKNGDPTGLKLPVLAPVSGGSSHSPNLLSESGSPHLPGIGGVSLRDVIANSISKNMQPPSHLEKRESLTASPHINAESYKWPKISVKQGLGAEVHRFGGGLPISASAIPSNSNALNNQMNNSTGTGGKGTRPKRGKYRNYDRDSLVEAVKAVQRGEMSVHRAGSYYGVPHSTLEYKVKERHLMRPRKREPKPQPLDERSSSSATSGLKVTDMGSVVRNAQDKSKNMPNSSKPRKSPAFDGLSPNGIKSGPFLEASSGQLQYSPMFWAHPPNFMDFSRATGVVGPSSVASFPTSDNFFPLQMRQRFQDHSAASEAGNSATSNSSGSRNSSANNSKSTTPNSAMPNNSKPPGMSGHRELSERFYEGTNSNGLLDGIIRHSLDRKSTDLHHGTLLDQLKNNLQLEKIVESGLVARKRESDSPPEFPSSLGIKRERTSPDPEGTSDNQSELLTTGHMIKLVEGGQNGGSNTKGMQMNIRTQNDAKEARLSSRDENDDSG